MDPQRRCAQHAAGAGLPRPRHRRRLERRRHAGAGLLRRLRAGRLRRRAAAASAAAGLCGPDARRHHAAHRPVLDAALRLRARLGLAPGLPARLRRGRQDRLALPRHLPLPDAHRRGGAAARAAAAGGGTRLVDRQRGADPEPPDGGRDLGLPAAARPHRPERPHRRRAAVGRLRGGALRPEGPAPLWRRRAGREARRHRLRRGAATGAGPADAARQRLHRHRRRAAPGAHHPVRRHQRLGRLGPGRLRDQPELECLVLLRHRQPRHRRRARHAARTDPGAAAPRGPAAEPAADGDAALHLGALPAGLRVAARGNRLDGARARGAGLRRRLARGQPVLLQHRLLARFRTARRPLHLPGCRRGKRYAARAAEPFGTGRGRSADRPLPSPPGGRP